MKRKWTKKDGTKVWIKDMDDDHLLAAMKLCHRFAWKKSEQSGWELVRYLANPHMGDAARESLERELDKGWWTYLPYGYWNLLKYAQKRKWWNEKLEKKYNIRGEFQFTTMSPYWVCHHDETVAINEEGHAGVYCVDCNKQLEDGC